MNPLNVRTKPKPGCCKTRRCKGKPRNLSTRPNSSEYCGSCHKKLWRMANPVKSAYLSLKSSAKRRGIKFTLTIEEWEAFVLPTRYLDESGLERHRLTVDRINPSGGYSKDNVQILTCSENASKGNRERYVQEKIEQWSDHVATEEEPF